MSWIVRFEVTVDHIGNTGFIIQFGKAESNNTEIIGIDVWKVTPGDKGLAKFNWLLPVRKGLSYPVSCIIKNKNIFLTI